MKIVILGAGQVGQSIARYLSSEENDVSLVDHHQDILRKMSDTLDIRPVLGVASHPDVLEKAGAKEADLLIAVTGSDETNIVACEVAHSLFSVRTKIARIRSEHYLAPQWATLFSPHHIAIDHIISPEIEVAKSIASSLQVTGVFDAMDIGKETLRTLGIHVPNQAPILHTPLRRLSHLFPTLDFTILCIKREGKSFIPKGDDVIRAEDEVHVLIPHQSAEDVCHAFGLRDEQNKRVLILGGGNIGLRLAKLLETHPVFQHSKLIERSPERAEYAARSLRVTEIFCGDGMDMNVLKEANIGTCEAIVSVTDDDRVNILSSLLGKHMGARRGIALLNQMNKSNFVHSLGVNSVINPRSITISTILQHIRQGRLRVIGSIQEDFAELVEVEVKESSAAIGLCLEDVMVESAILIASLIRDNDIQFVPDHKTLIRVGDQLILLVKKSSIPRMEKLFTHRMIGQ